MAIQREIWINSIVEGLFADTSFLSKAYNRKQRRIVVNSRQTLKCVQM